MKTQVLQNSIEDFKLGKIIQIEDEQWKIVKPEIKGNKFFMIPYNKEAKDKYVSIAIEFNLSDFI